MSMADIFTAGKWRFSTANLLRVHSGLEVICGVHRLGRVTGKFRESETFANGRLIASAPKMLEALRKVETALLDDAVQKTISGDDVVYNLDGGTMTLALGAVRAAIEAAT